MRRRTYLCTMIGGLTATAGCLGNFGDGDGEWSNPVASWAEGTIEFALPPFQAVEDLEREYAGLFAWLADGFDVEVEGQPTTSYAGAVESVVGGHSELANLSPLIYTLAAEEGITPLAVNELHGASSYHAIVATRAETGLDSLEALEGRTIAMVDPLSTSGGLFPLHMLETAGLDTGGIDEEPSGFEIEWTFSHGAALSALEAGHVDAAAYGDFQHPDDEAIVTIEESPPIPLAAAVAAPETPLEVVEALTDRLLDTPAEALEEHMVTGFAEYDPADYELVLEIADGFGLSVADLDDAASED